MINATLKRNFARLMKNRIDGQWVKSAGPIVYDIKDPTTQNVVGQVPQCTEQEFNDIVANSKETFQEWKEVSVSNRVRFMLKYQELIKKHEMDLVHMITEEHGKSHLDAKGDVFRGYEIIEHTCSLTSLLQGETTANVAKNVDIISYRRPLGVTAGIVPFNFPAMCPLWMIPMSITCGNTFILKPSERVAGTAEIMIDLLEQSGVPKGVVNVAQGTRDTVNYMCDHPDIKAISFVGGNGAGEHIYKRASQRGCRVQSNMGAKNHAIIMPDADKDDAINAMIGACFGSAGQRCMAQTVSIMVGETQDWIPEIVERTKKLTIGHGKENPDLVALCGRDALERAHGIIKNSETDGSKILLDGRGV